MMNWVEPHAGYNAEHGYHWSWHRHATCLEARRTIRRWNGGAAIIFTIGEREVSALEMRAYIDRHAH